MKLRFGDLSFDGRRRLLYRGASPVHVSSRAFELLALLLERRPEAVAREEITEALWPGGDAQPGGLASVVSELRQGLGAPASGSPWIRTVHGFGYAFDGEAHELPRSPRHVLFRGLQHVELAPGGNVLGREKTAAVRLGHPSVAHEHARIVVTDDRAELEDLTRSGSTFRGGEAVGGRVVLEDGDVIGVGEIRLTYRILEGDVGG